MLPTFYINLDRDVDRRAAIEAQLQRVGIEARRYPAVLGDALPSDLAAHFAHGDGRPPLMKSGEIGCYASHLGIWREIVASGFSAALVLEDDAMLAPDIRELIDDVLARAPSGWDFIHMCGKDDRAVRPLAPLVGGRQLVRYSRIPNATAGYLISGIGAAKMLNPRILRVWPIDWDTRTPWVFGMDTYGVTPAPIEQDTTTLDSTIRKVSSGRTRLRSGFPRPTAYTWTNNPIRTPASFVFNFKTLGPLWWLRCFASNCGIKLAHLLRPVRRRQRAG